ncbi:MAG: hypothetical protein UU08_C0020G0005 [Candidatus Uhrbacteria bacterium GW2011_GWE2_40_58]|nr:MAG: hypothetical protein UT94_C0025G0005 [Candidatus Uhrbacteria bacterium GW2011_GWF2_40_263]KKR67313.1 MAG: hypothetical protein UU08_C0020G0005 [Candidatus Uhrbacteria bacterium GW2011_GWE2_40_58]
MTGVKRLPHFIRWLIALMVVFISLFFLRGVAVSFYYGENFQACFQGISVLFIYGLLIWFWYANGILKHLWYESKQDFESIREQIKVDRSEVTVKNTQVRALEDLLQRLCGLPTLGAGSFNARFDHYSQEVGRYIAVYVESLPFYDVQPDARIRDAQANVWAFERCLNLLFVQHQMIREIGTTLDLSFVDACNVTDEQIEESRQAVLVALQQMKAQADQVHKLETKKEELSIALLGLTVSVACVLYKLRPEKRVEEMTEEEMRKTLLEAIRGYRQGREEMVESFILGLETMKIDFEKIRLNAEWSPEDLEIVRASLKDTVQKWLRERKLLGRKDGTDHPQARALIEFCLVQPLVESKKQ